MSLNKWTTDRNTTENRKKIIPTKEEHTTITENNVTEINRNRRDGKPPTISRNGKNYVGSRNTLSTETVYLRASQTS